MKRPILFLILITAVLFARPARAASSVSERMAALAKQLVAGSTETAPAGTRTSVAVLPLTVSPALERENIGFAFSELLTHAVSRTGRLDVLERSQIQDVLREQKFQETGAVDSQSASNVGKLIGAKDVIVGSVVEVGRQFQINARLVEVETARVIATGYEEIPSSDFRDEAGAYLKLVPLQQTLGVYGLYQWAGRTSGPSTADVSNGQVHLRKLDLAFLGGGFRYVPKQHLMLDAAYMVPVGDTEVGTLIENVPGGPLVKSMDLSASYALRIMAALSFFADQKTGWHLGVGVMHYNLFASSGGSDNDFTLKETVPFLRIGMEFRPQDRFALGLGANYSLKKAEGQINGASAGGSAIEINRFSLEPTVAFYF